MAEQSFGRLTASELGRVEASQPGIPTMKKPLLTIATLITTAAASTSLALATVPNPTDIQKQLSTTANTIAIAGTTALFGLLDDNDDGKSENR